jgi:hypothetical protein
MAPSRTKSQKTLVPPDVLWEEVERVERVEQVERPRPDAYYVPQLNIPLREVQLSPPFASSFTLDPVSSLFNTPYRTSWGCYV